MRDTFVDYGANCGNMSSAVGPFALDEGLVTGPANGEATVRIHAWFRAQVTMALDKTVVVGKKFNPVEEEVEA